MRAKRLSLVASAVVLLVLLAAPANAAFPGQNGKIAFSSLRDGNGDIYTINPDGTALTRLTETAEAERWPKWSPDGKRIAFMRWDPGSPPGPELWVMNADGTGQTKLIRADDWYESVESWSPDGQSIVYTRNAPLLPRGLAIVAAAGGAPHVVLRHDEPGTVLDPAWSPDGGTIAFVDTGLTSSSQDIFTVKPDGTGLRRLTATTDEFETAPAWSPDGSRIAYEDRFFNTGVHTIGSDGTGVAIIPGTGFDRRPEWAPDGTRLVVATFDVGAQTQDLATLNPDGSGRALVTHTPWEESQPDWQPLVGPKRSDFKNAAKFCKAEREFLGEDAFRERYGGGANAHGKCVSGN